MVTSRAPLNDSMQVTFLNSALIQTRFATTFVLALAMLSACFVGGCNVPTAGPPIPAVIEGDSMAPTIPGAHLAVACIDCGFEFTTELVDGNDTLLTCSNCGHPEILAADAKRVAPTVAQILPIMKFPRRWEVVGLKLPQQEDAVVKRIVGLPNETVRIGGGDLFTESTILRKPWRVQKELRVPVFDSKFSAIVPYENQRRFRTAANSGWWISKNARFDAAQRTTPNETSWLDYVHWRNCRHAGKRDAEFVIDDHYGFNQTTARDLNPTDDLMLQLDLDFVEPDSKFVFAFRRGAQEYVFEVTHIFASNTEPGSLQLKYDGDSQRKPLQMRSKLEADSPKVTFEFSSFDRALQMRLNGTPVFELREDETADPVASESSQFDAECLQPFRIGGKQGSFRIDRLRIWRDIFYLPENRKLTAEPESYILLGDNVPRSLDSRDWKIPGVQRQQLLGTLEIPVIAEQ